MNENEQGQEEVGFLLMVKHELNQELIVEQILGIIDEVECGVGGCSHIASVDICVYYGQAKVDAPMDAWENPDVQWGENRQRIVAYQVCHCPECIESGLEVAEEQATKVVDRSIEKQGLDRDELFISKWTEDNIDETQG